MLTPLQARSPENVMNVRDVEMSDAVSVSLCIQTLTLRFESVPLSHVRDVPAERVTPETSC